MTDQPIEIRDQNNLIARIYPSGLKTNNVIFYSDDDESFQAGIHQNNKGDQLSAHSHTMSKSDHLTISNIAELVYVQFGKIKVDLYGVDNEFLSSHILGEHDAIVFNEGGHGVEFLEDSKIFMIKQGPYIGVKNKPVKE